MRIAIDVRRLRDFGIGTYIRNLVCAFGEINASDEFLLISHGDAEDAFRRLPSNFRIIPHRFSDLQRADEVAFPWLLRRLKPDLTHIPLSRVSLLQPRPYVITIHDVSNFLFDEPPPFVKELRRVRFLRGVQNAVRVITVSNSTRRDLENLASIDPTRIRMVYNAPDPSFFRPGGLSLARAAGPEVRSLERRRILERYQIRPPFLLYAGHIRRQKNIPRLVEAFAVARQQLAHHPKFAGINLLIIGDEISRHPEVRRAVIQSRVEDCVRFLGFVPFDTLRLFYELATAFVFPSLYEGFGLPPIEAMASGTPVIASNVTALPEVVGDAAVLVNPENVFDIARGICDVLQDERLRADLTSRGRARAASFSWHETASKVLEIYREAAHKPGWVRHAVK